MLSKRKIATLASIATLFTSTFIGSSAFAYTQVNSFMTEDAIKNYIDAAGDATMSLDYAAGCLELNDVIAHSDGYLTNIFLTENCSSDILIGTGKKVNLYTNYYKKNYQDGDRYYATFINMNSDAFDGYKVISNSTAVAVNITGRTVIEDGATAILDGRFGAIENHGTAMLLATVNGTVENDGTLNIVGGNLATASFSSTPAEWFEDVYIPVAIEVDVPYAFSGIKNPELAEAFFINAKSTDISTATVTGTPMTGITITGIKSGVIGLHFKNDHQYMSNNNPNLYRYQEVLFYELPANTPTATRQMINRIINEELGEVNAYGMIAEGEIAYALAQAGAINIKYPIEILNPSDIPADIVAKINAAVDGVDIKIAQYYDIDATIVNSNTSEVLIDVTDLGDDFSQNITISIPDGLDEVAEGKKREYYIYRVHDGVVEELDATEKDGYITFATNKFSIYAVGYADVVSTPDTGLITTSTDGTEMNSIYGFIIAITATITISTAVFLISRKITTRRKINF